MKTRIETKGRLPRWLALLLLLGALMVPMVRAGVAGMPAAAREGEAPLDLAAMALTPDDLANAGFPGYLINGGQSEGTGSLTYLVGLWTDQITDHDIKSILEADGLQRGYHLHLRLPQEPGDPQSSPVRDVEASVHEFADADGAFEAFTFLSYLPKMTDGSIAVQQIRGKDRVGDGSAMVRTSFESEGNPGQELDFAFLTDRMIALIRIWDFTNQEPPIADAKVMATRLLKRIKTSLAGQAPGLGPRILRLVPNEADRDQYLRRDGEDLPLQFESADERSSRIESAGDASDMYEYVEQFQPDDPAWPAYMYMLWTSRIYRFPDDGAAAAWFEAQRARPTARAEAGSYGRGYKVSDLSVIEGVPTFGDESFAVSYTEGDGEGSTSQVRSIRFRVGAVTAEISLAADDPPLAAVEAMTAHQVACLGEAGCPDPVPVADALATPTVGPNRDSTLDLPAMTLTPSDVEEAGLPGFGLAYVENHISGWRTIGDIAYDSPAHQAGSFGYLTLDQINVKLPRTGWLRQYRRILAIPDANDPNSVDMSVFSEVGEYVDAEGAETALDLLTHGGEAEEATDDSVGDRLEIRRDVLYRVGSRLTLSFRDGNLIGTVVIIRYATEDGAELAPALHLAHRLQERISSGVAHPGPGLSGVALRLATIANPAEEEGYLRLDGETFPFFGGTEEDLAATSAAFRDSVDVYELSQLLEPGPGKRIETVFINRLFRFPDEAAAGSWLEALPQGLAEDAANSGGTFEVDQLADSSRIGDESLTFAVTHHPDGGTLRSYRIYARVGVYGVRLQFGAADEPPLEVAEELAIAQVDCLRAGSCAKVVQLPSNLAGLSCPPVSQPDVLPLVGAGPERGAVPMNGADPAHTGANPGPGPTGSPKEQWQFAAPGVGGRGPVAADGLLYLTSLTSAAIRDDLVANLYAVDAATGTQRWCVTTGREVADPVVADGLVFTLGREIPGDHEQAFVVALNAKTGIERWRFSIDPVLDSTFGGITVADGTVYVDTVMGALFALDASTGAPRWLANLRSGDDDYLDHLTAPAVADGVVYVADSHILHAIDAATGEERWRFRPDADHEWLRTPTVVDGIVYLPGINDLYAVDAESGEERWRFTTENSLGNGLAVVDGVVYLGTGSNDSTADVAYLYALDAGSGDQLWRFDTEGYVSIPAVVGDVVYVGTGVEGLQGEPDGTVVALAAADGEELWSFPVGGMATSPVVLDGRVYVSTWTPRVYDKDQILFAIGGTTATTDVAQDPR